MRITLFIISAFSFLILLFSIFEASMSTFANEAVWLKSISRMVFAIGLVIITGMLAVVREINELRIDVE